MLRLTTFLLSVLLLAASSCKERKHVIPQKEIVKQPTEINKTATDIIKEFLANPADTQLSTLKNISFLKTGRTNFGKIKPASIEEIKQHLKNDSINCRP